MEEVANMNQPVIHAVCTTILTMTTLALTIRAVTAFGLADVGVADTLTYLLEEMRPDTLIRGICYTAVQRISQRTQCRSVCVKAVSVVI